MNGNISRFALGSLLAATTALLAPGVSGGLARADGLDGEYGAPGPYAGEPAYMDNNQQAQAQDPQNQPQGPEDQGYQPPPDNVCYDEEQRAYDCTTDSDFATYSQVDDGYDPQAYQDFEQTLAPYGSWEDVPSYGRVWSPAASAVGVDFTPYYSNGRWSLTDYGWTWASDYDWGWAPFHYGRWLTLPGRGWCWVPGRIWGPAWVHWRHGGGYVGWTALPPRGIRIAPPLGARAAHWNFVPAPQLGAGRLARLAPNMVPSYYHRTVPGNVLRAVGNTRVNIGPPPGILSLGEVRPFPLRSLPGALPRSQVTVGVGVPLASRPYVTTARPGWGRGPGSIPIGPRPGFQPGPTYQPGVQRPGFYGPSNQPGFQPAPTYRPGFQPAPIYRPGPTPAPSFQPGPSYRPAPMPAPSFQPGPSYRPGPTPAPSFQPGPSYRPGPTPVPSFQPAPSYRPAPTPAPSFQPAPSYRPAPTPAPSFQPAPTFRPAPSYQPAPTFRPAPSFQPAPSYRPAPTPAPSFQPAPTFRPAPSFQPSGGGPRR